MRRVRGKMENRKRATNEHAMNEHTTTWRAAMEQMKRRSRGDMEGGWERYHCGGEIVPRVGHKKLAKV